MGGRSEHRHDRDIPDRFSWIRELSDERLENYGRYGAIAVDHAERHRGRSPDVVNYYASIEYKNRHGVEPDWKR